MGELFGSYHVLYEIAVINYYIVKLLRVSGLFYGMFSACTMTGNRDNVFSVKRYYDSYS